MKLALRSLIVTVAVALIASFAAAQVPQFSPFTADMQMTSTGGPHGSQEMTGKMFVGSGHMRMNMSTQGHETAVITDFATKTVDVLMVQPKMYMEHQAGQMPRRGVGNPAEEMKPFDPANPCANQPDVTCKKIGVETVSGRTCDHWEITDKNGKVSNVWVDEKLHFPIKMVSQDATILLTNIQEGEPDAGLFQIPADYHKMDMGGMMPQGMGHPPN
ncbi:MAG TPA: DUF4412 domain-containing protein [Candidatus Angelobacter sp.]|jgi:hypothetical protein|nr:DUF4412 domain-containing protein [Candidatus Angelobacter sp.]